MVRFEFGKNEWKRDSDGAIQRFHGGPFNYYTLEIAGSKYNGVLHAGGHYRLTDNTLFSTLKNAWIDNGRGGGENGSKLSAQAEKELGFKQEQKRRITWLDANTFKLTEHWWSTKGEIWRRQPGEVEGDRWHYSPAHKVPERWVDGRGWVPEQPEASSEKTPAPVAPAPDTAATTDREAINEAVVEWLGLLDKGDYPGSFAAASAGFRKGLTTEKWKAGHAAMQKQFGAFISRSGRVTLRTRTSTTDNGKQEVGYILDIQSKFSKTTGTEHITLVKESGEWKVADYSIEVKTP